MEMLSKLPESQHTSSTKHPNQTTDLLRRIESLGNIGHWEIDLTTGENFWSEQIYRIFGINPAEVSPTTDLAVAAIHPADRPFVLGVLQQAIDAEDSFKTEMRILRPGGEIRHIITEGTVLRSPERDPLRLFGVSRDITEEKRKETNLQKSNIQLENILKTTQDLIFLADENGMFLRVSTSCEKILGYSAMELIGKSFRDLIHPEDFQKTIQNRRSIMEGNSSSDFRNRYFKKDGSVIHLSWSATLDTTTNSVFAVARDITQILRDKEQLRLDRQKMSILLDSSPETIWALDRDYRLITANTKFLRTMKKAVGWELKSGDNLIYHTPFPADFMEGWKSLYDRAFAGETFSTIRKPSVITKDGYLEVTFKPIFEEGTPTAVCCYSLDVTERIEKELEMQELVNRINQAQKIGKLGYWEVDLETKALYWSDEVYHIWEIDQTTFTPTYDHFFNSIHPDDLPKFMVHHRNAWNEITPMDTVHRILLPGGKIKFIHEKGGLETDPETGVRRYHGMVQDVTKEKLIERELRNRNNFIESTLENLPLGIAVTKISTGEPTYINPAFGRIYGWESDLFKDIDNFYQKIFPDQKYREHILRQIQADIQSGDPDKMSWSNLSITTQTGDERIINGKNILLPDQDLMISTVMDDTDRYWAEHFLLTSNERFNLATQAVSDAIWDWDIQTDVCFWSEGFTKLFGIDISKESSSAEFWSKRVHPDDFPTVQSLMNQLQGKKDEVFFELEYRFQRQDNSYAYVFDKVFVIRDENGTPVRMVGAIRDITHHRMYEESLKNLNRELANSNRELEISNKELEQFAYVASHDLQEPLRMISSFLGLLQKKYSPQLDDKGLQYIHYAVDGARRMREIILDLLEFSRVGNNQEPRMEISTQKSVQEVLHLNAKLIQEKDAVIHLGNLPSIFGYGNSMIQLFQNLITNGLKYQAIGNKPEVWIEGEELELEWRFSVRDNGIGIDTEFYDKIFIIFQRLHQKDQYSGSGIGLAICKKIVELHGGKIWLKSSPGLGSTFYFTISK